MPEKYYLPKDISVSIHASTRYLERILNVTPSRKKIYIAMLFLTFVLRNRAMDIVGTRKDEAAYRIQLAYKGIVIIYEPSERQICTVLPDKREKKDKLELIIKIPADFRISNELRRTIGINKVEMYSQSWPVVGRWCKALIIEVNGQKIAVDTDRKKLFLRSEYKPYSKIKLRFNKKGLDPKRLR